MRARPSSRLVAWRGLLTAVLLIASPAQAEPSLDLSGFATLGGAISDQDFTYQRVIDEDGTLNRDSVIGLQLDATLADAWAITAQLKGAPAMDSDTGWEPTLSWAFLAWRPSNDLLLRAGKLRLPLMLYSANSDVGTTFEFARLPTEVYSVTPTADVLGLSFAKTWLDQEREWMLEGYLGTAETDWRFYAREGLSADLPGGASYQGLTLEAAGLVLSMRDERKVFRVGVHRADSELDFGPTWTSYPFVTLAPGIGYYQVSDALPGPGVPTADKVVNYVLTASAELSLPRDYRLIGEFVRRRMTNATLGPDTSAGYLALLKRIGRWTPYLYYAAIRTDDTVMDLFEGIDENQLPDTIPGASAINLTQRTGADMLTCYDQQSLAIGASYSLTATSKIKAEWMHTRTGRVSSFVDAPAGEKSGDRDVNVFSLSYSLTF